MYIYGWDRAKRYLYKEGKEMSFKCGSCDKICQTGQSSNVMMSGYRICKICFKAFGEDILMVGDF